ncbi:hypothetical protein [Pseudomonas sp. ZS1P83]
MSEPKVIYLGPACEASTGDGRSWAEDNPWTDCECGHRPVQYVLGETFERMKAERDALQLRLNAADQRIDELTQVLERGKLWIGQFRAWYGDSGVVAEDHLMIIRTLKGLPHPPTEFDKPLTPNPEAADQFRDAAKMIGIERMPPMEYDEP